MSAPFKLIIGASGNTISGISQFLYGIISLPAELFVADDDNENGYGLDQIERGLFNTIASLPEFVGFRIRHPVITSMSQEEKEAFANYQEKPALNQYLLEKYKK